MFQALIGGLLFGLGLSISMGPVLFAIIRNSVASGTRAGISFVLGVNLADIFFIIASLWMSRYLAKLGAYQYWIGLVGSGLFIFFGLIGYFKKENLYQYRESQKEYGASGGGLVKYWFSGFFFNLLNPGAIALWLSINLAAVSYTQSEKIIFFAVILIIVLLSDIFKVFLAGLLKKKLTIRNIVYVNKISSAILVVFGIVILIRTLYLSP